MIAMFWKELRENFKWAALIFGVLAVTVYVAIQDANAMFFFRLADRYSATVMPLAGLLLGVFQSFFDTRADNWAFDVHRPASRAQVFAAKCGAGLTLLYAALALPLAAAAIWAAQPGRLPVPFQWRMLLPLVIDVFTSGCFYFAGIVVTLRRARWHGSRLLPLGLPVLCSLIVIMLTPQFWQALVVVLVAQTLLALAAWNVFSSAGEADRDGLPAFALGATIFAGAIVAGMVLQLIPQPFYTTNQWQQFMMDGTGNVLHVTWTRDRDSDYGRSSTITDAAGDPLSKYDGVDIDDPGQADRFVRFGAALVHDPAIAWPASLFYVDGGYREATGGLVRLNAVAPPGGRVRSQCCYNVQRQVIELYDPVTRLLEGTVGPAGFVVGQSAPQQFFPGTPQNLRRQGNMHALAFSTAVYWLELDQRRVRQVFTATADDSIFSALEISPQKDPKVLIATHKKLHLLRPSGEVLFSVDLPATWDGHYFQPAILPDNNHLVVFVDGILNPAYHAKYLEYESDGQLVRETKIPNEPELARVKIPQSALFGMMFPPMAIPFIAPWQIDTVFDLRTWPHPWLFYGFMAGAAILSATTTVFLAQRCGLGFPKTIAWTLANLLLGPSGVIVLLSLNDWPTREACAACGGQRLAGRRECQHCGAALPPPAADGREIFEPADDFQTAA